MKSEISVSPQNSIVFLTDGLLYDDGSIDIPEVTPNGQIVWANSTCVIVGTLSEFDGESHLVLSDERPSSNAPILIFDGFIDTPSKELAFSNVPNEILITFSVSEVRTHVKIWVNDESEPDAIHVMVV